MGRADDHPGLALAYYASRGETPLAWGGSGCPGASAWSGSSPTRSTTTSSVRAGFRDPTTGTRLVATRRPGIELVVSAHKSVALLGVIGWADEMHAILDAETDATLGLPRRLGPRRRAVGGAGPRPAPRREGWCMPAPGMPRHGPAIPEPHDHVLIANLVEMLDERGGRKALDTAADPRPAARRHDGGPGGRRRARRSSSASPSNPMRARPGSWDTGGSPGSRRRRVTCSRSGPPRSTPSMAGPGLDSYQARQVAARDTRRAKRHTPVDDLMPRWHAELDAAGCRRRAARAFGDRGRPGQAPPERLLGDGRSIAGRRGARPGRSAGRAARCSPAATSSWPSPPPSTGRTRPCSAGRGSRVLASPGGDTAPRRAERPGAGLRAGVRDRRRGRHRPT